MWDAKRIADAVRDEGGISRRLMLAYGGALAALPLVGTRAAAADRKVSFPSDPFTLGVASGDPDAGSVVIWTKLAPRPLDADGGMPPEPVAVAWEVADDEGMKSVVARGTAVATVPLGHSVHVEVPGLAPDRWYFYRFRAGDALSPVGRTRTLPAADALPDRLRFSVVSCQHYEQGLYTAYEQMARDNLDLVFHLGDYIYENPHRANPKLVRKHTGPKSARLKSLADYRERHALYRSDPLLQRMHAACPWFVTWDDHEVDNNYANDIAEERKNQPPVDPAAFLIQRAAAYQAYYEMMPLRRRSLPRGPDMLLYRSASFGRLADFFVLDTRQYRTDQPNGDGLHPLNADALRPTNSLLGQTQRRWLDAALIASASTWNVLAQQVMMGMVELETVTGKGFDMDQWPGAAHERIALMRFIADRRIPNPVVLTGDIHSNWVNDLRVDDRQPETPVVATEFVATSISSDGTGPKVVAGLDKLLAANPVVRFHNRERGYIRCAVSPKLWTSDYVVCEDVLQPGGPVLTRASFVVEAGVPGSRKA
jgi:alkaline phosphatase D